MDQRIALTNLIVAALNEINISIKGLSTYTKQITFGGASVVNSAGVTGLLGGLSATGFIASLAAVASVSGALEIEQEIASSVAEVAGASAGLDTGQVVSGSLAATSNILNAVLKDLTIMLAGISESEPGANAALRDVTDSIAGVSQAHSTTIGWMIDP